MSTRHFNNLTPGEAERLAMLAEECGEVIQAVGKILRHGGTPASTHQAETKAATTARIFCANSVTCAPSFA